MDWRNDSNILNYIEHVKQRCIETEVELKLVDALFVGEGAMRCAGYFDSENYELVAVTQDLYDPNRWVTLLVHEASHLEQWSDQCEAWLGTTVKEGYDAYTMFDMWLNHLVELNPTQLKDYALRCQAVEIDCEKRSVETIKKFNLPFDIDEYTQRANAYAFQWQFMMKHRRWSIPGKAPSSIKEVYSLMSNKFDMDYHSPLPAEIEEAYMKCFYE